MQVYILELQIGRALLAPYDSCFGLHQVQGGDLMSSIAALLT